MTGIRTGNRLKDNGGWKVPLFEPFIGEEEREAVLKVLEKKWFTLGEETYKFEQEFARYIGTKYAIFLSSGTAALHLAYKVLDIKPSSKVLVPDYTFLATLTPLIWLHVKPFVGDIKSLKHLNLDPEEIEKIKPDYVVYVPFAGFMEGYEQVIEAVEQAGAILIEDCSHAHGSIYKGFRCGQRAKIGVYSLYSNKNITSLGEGGMLITNCKEIYERAKLLRSHGMTAMAYDKTKRAILGYQIKEIGYNYRATEIQAAFGRVQLRRLDELNKRRREIVKAYREAFEEIPYIVVPFENFENSANYIFPILVPYGARERLALFLFERGIQVSWHYRSIHKFSVLRKHLSNKQFPYLSPIVSMMELTLPLYSSMEWWQVEYVIENVSKFFKR